MADKPQISDQHGSSDPIRLAEHFARSKKFKTLFRDGMNLVEECANFLDGPGRQAARTLPRTASVLYASESMRITTRMMQLASWLLLQRSVGEGEMTHAQVVEEKKKVKFYQLRSTLDGPGWSELPEKFVNLVQRSMALQKRIQLLDDEIYHPDGDVSEPVENPVNAQLDLLAAVYGTAK